MTTQRLDLSQPLSVPQPDTLEPPSGIIIERVQPEIDGGRYPATGRKRRCDTSTTTAGSAISF